MAKVIAVVFIAAVCLTGAFFIGVQVQAYDQMLFARVNAALGVLHAP